MIHSPQETHFSSKGAHRLKGNGWEKIYHTTINKKSAEIVVVISNKIDFK
jgi:hypothetical protein